MTTILKWNTIYLLQKLQVNLFENLFKKFFFSQISNTFSIGFELGELLGNFETFTLFLHLLDVWHRAEYCWKILLLYSGNICRSNGISFLCYYIVKYSSEFIILIIIALFWVIEGCKLMSHSASLSLLQTKLTVFWTKRCV